MASRLLPDRVGPYEPVEVLGMGGMSSVYLARGPTGRPVALKIVRGDIDRAMDASLREARVLGLLAHPNVVRLYDAGLHEGNLYLVLELVLGPSLAHVLAAARARGIRMGVGVALRIALDALEGLRAAHDAIASDGRPLAVVHRDVSPQNVLVDTDGHAKIADFGIAKFAGSGSATRTGEVPGKLAYLAPEQFASQTDRRSDLYAMAVVLWECLAGRRLFTGDEAAMLLDIVQGNAQPLHAARPDVPPALAAAVDRGTARDPAQRFDDASAMIDALRAAGPVASHEDVVRFVDLVLPGERDRKRRAADGALARRRPASRAWLLAVAGVVLVASLVGVGIFVGHKLGTSEGARRREASPRDAEDDQARSTPETLPTPQSIREAGNNEAARYARSMDKLTPAESKLLLDFPCRFEKKDLVGFLRARRVGFLAVSTSYDATGGPTQVIGVSAVLGKEMVMITFFANWRWPTPPMPGAVPGDPPGCFYSEVISKSP